MPVGAQFPAGQVGDHLLGRGREAAVAVAPVAEAQKFRPVLLPAAGFHPQVAGLDHGHEDFLRARAVHFLPHDSLDLAQNPQAERQKGVDARRELSDEAAPQKQLVADDLGLGRDFLGGGEEEL